jgi:hypothetical protein
MESNISYVEQAKAIIHGERNEDYGPMRDGFEATAKIWSATLRKKLTADITPEEVCLLMIGLKLSREGFKHKDDNLVDMVGYAEISSIININH